MDYIAICKAFYAATGIPIVLQRTRESPTGNAHEGIGELVFSSVEFTAGIPSSPQWTTFRGKGRPVFCGVSPDFEYGMVFIDGTDLSIIIGPLSSCPITEDIVNKYMVETQTPPAFRSQLSNVMEAAPMVSHARYAWILAFLNMVINRRDFDIDTLYDTRQMQSEILKLAAANRVEQLEAGNRHVAFETEQRLYDVIREGSVARLDAFLQAIGGNFHEGQLAKNPLRHARNVFIVTISKLVSISAIPGGMDAELAYGLMDTYVQECEQQNTVEAVHLLQYSMLRDFTLRIGKARLPEGISPDIYEAVEYIRFHFNAPICVADVAKHLGRSESYVTHRFRAEMGCGIGEYVTNCRLEEAESLLLHSSQSLAEISSYLCFSSQPYFQNVFKKKYGMTPMQYRRQGSSD